jgi:hypothetical protein
MKPHSRSPSYLILNPYGYCFRMRVPPDLQSTIADAIVTKANVTLFEIRDGLTGPEFGSRLFRDALGPRLELKNKTVKDYYLKLGFDCTAIGQVERKEGNLRFHNRSASQAHTHSAYQARSFYNQTRHPTAQPDFHCLPMWLPCSTNSTPMSGASITTSSALRSKSCPNSESVQKPSNAMMPPKPLTKESLNHSTSRRLLKKSPFAAPLTQPLPAQNRYGKKLKKIFKSCYPRYPAVNETFPHSGII